MSASFIIYRQEVRPFTEKQIELVTELRRSGRHRHRERAVAQRTAQRTGPQEALEQQTATSEVLQVISSSPGDLEPVFATMLENAVRICDAKFGNIYRRDDGGLRLVATHNTPPAFAEARGGYVRSSPAPDASLLDMVMTTKTSFTSPILQRREATLNVIPESLQPSNLAAYGRLLAVPMLKEDELDRCILPSTARKFVPSPTSRSSWSRTSPLKPSSPSRTRGCLTNCGSAPLTLPRQQTRQTSEGAPGYHQALPAILSRCLRPCWRMPFAFATPNSAIIYRWEGEAFAHVASHNTPPAFAEDAAGAALIISPILTVLSAHA